MSAPGHWRSLLRIGVGLLLFSVVVVWVVRDGSYLENLNARAVAASLAVSVLTSLLQAATLVTIASANTRALGYAQALRVTALGSLGNAAGGLPIGTAVKFGILHGQVGLSLGQITTGLALTTLVIVATLLACASLSALWLAVPDPVAALPATALLGLLACCIAPLSVPALRRRVPEAVRGWLAAYAPARVLRAVLALGALTAGTFVLNSCLVGWLLGTGGSLAEIVFLSSTGIVIGLASLLQSIAGVHEFALAFTAYVAGVQPIDGVQIALTLRATAIGAALLLLAGAAIVPPRNRATG